MQIWLPFLPPLDVAHSLLVARTHTHRIQYKQFNPNAIKTDKHIQQQTHKRFATANKTKHSSTHETHVSYRTYAYEREHLMTMIVIVLAIDNFKHLKIKR